MTATTHKPAHKAAHTTHAKPNHRHEDILKEHKAKTRTVEHTRAAVEKESDAVKDEEVALKSSQANPPHSEDHDEKVVAPKAEVLSDLQALSNKFRSVADNHDAVMALANAGVVNVPAINPSNPTVYNLTESEAVCMRFKDATNGNEVRLICDEIDARKK